jgi:hypothetical protein
MVSPCDDVVDIIIHLLDDFSIDVLHDCGDINL